MGVKQQGQNVIVAFKKQSGLGVPASGAGGTLMEVRPSAGLGLAVATIESQMFRRNRMKIRPRHGSKSLTAQYETELQVGNCDKVFEGVLGAAAATASFTISNADVGSLTITGTGTILTGASGSFLSLGLVAGMEAKLTGMSVAGNNAKWFPIVSVTASTITIPSGILADNALDASFTLTTAKYYATPTPYVDQYYTFEERLPDITVPINKIGTDMKFGSLNIGADPGSPITVGFGLTGRDMTAPSGAATLTNPVANPQPNPSSLVALDGAIYKNGVAVLDFTGATFGLAAPLTLIPVLGSRLSPDVFTGMFALTGSFTQLIEDGAPLANFLAEDIISVHMHCAERETDPADFVSFYIGNCSFGGWGGPIADGAMTQTLTLYSGSDTRGAGYKDTALLISTSSA